MLISTKKRMFFAGAFLSIVLVVSWKPGPYGEICEHNNATNKKDCTSYEFAPFIAIKVFNALNNYGVAITALATVAISYFTLTLKLSTDQLWEAGEKQRRLYEITASRQLRAYVSIDGGSIRRNGTQLRLILNCKNFGQTPAYHFRSWTRMQLLERTANPFDGLGIDNPEMVLGPTGEIELTGSAAIEDENIAKIRTGESAIFVWGKINYIDAFDKPQHFNFRCINGIEVDQGVWAIEPHENGGYEAS